MSDGVFGNLPGSRPGSRSPRRRSGDAAEPPKAKPKPKPPPRKRAAAAPPTPAPPPTPERTPPAPPEAEGPGGLEDVAWAGVAVAAEAATIGVRLASRAIEALRGSTERDREKRAPDRD